MCSGGSDRSIVMRFTVSIPELTDGTLWNFRAGTDFGMGNAVYVDGNWH
jgi:hypothetical protein